MWTSQHGCICSSSQQREPLIRLWSWEWHPITRYVLLVRNELQAMPALTGRGSPQGMNRRRCITGATLRPTHQAQVFIPSLAPLPFSYHVISFAKVSDIKWGNVAIFSSNWGTDLCSFLKLLSVLWGLSLLCWGWKRVPEDNGRKTEFAPEEGVAWLQSLGAAVVFVSCGVSSFHLVPPYVTRESPSDGDNELTPRWHTYCQRNSAVRVGAGPEELNKHVPPTNTLYLP